MPLKYDLLVLAGKYSSRPKISVCSFNIGFVKKQPNLLMLKYRACRVL